MALTDSIMSLFGGGNKAQPTAVTTATGNPSGSTAVANTTVPSQATPASNGSLAAIPAAGTGDALPLGNFATLWEADKNSGATPQSMVPAFNLDPTGLMEMASKVNFTGHIPKELATKALGGDVEAFMEVINKATQLGFANATATSGELVRNSLTSAQGILTSSVLPTALRNQAVSAALDASNPIFSNPAVSPMLNSLKAQLQQKNPTASAQEIATFATDYLSQMSQMIVSASGGAIVTKNQQSPTGFLTPKEEDWTKFFDA